MESKDTKIITALSKHFDYVCVGHSLIKEQLITISCSCMEFNWFFYFSKEDYKKYNPYDIVNTIWEYISKYML